MTTKHDCRGNSDEHCSGKELNSMMVNQGDVCMCLYMRVSCVLLCTYNDAFLCLCEQTFPHRQMTWFGCPSEHQ